MASIDSVNVAKVSYSQTGNTNGTNSNGSCTQGVKVNTTRTYGKYSNTIRYTVSNQTAACSFGDRSYGKYADGENSNGSNSYGSLTNGYAQASNTRETTYTNI